MGGFLQAVRGLLGGGADASGPGQGQGLDQAKVLQFVQDRWNDLKNAYVVYHQSIWQSLLFYANQSWIDWDDARKVWQPQQPTDEWVPRPRINRFSPTMDAVASNFAQLPEIEAVPKMQDDPDSHMIADVCSDLADYIVVKEGLKHQQGQQADKVGLAAQLFVLCGGLLSVLRVNRKKLGQAPKMSMGPASGYECQNCDKYVQSTGEQPPQFCPDCGNAVEVSQTEAMQPELDESGQPVMEDQQENEVTCDIETLLAPFPRPGATSMENSPYLLLAKRRPIDTIWTEWNYDAQPDAVWPDGYSVTYEHALNFWYTGYSSSTIQVKDSCMALEMYVAPKKLKDHPDGFYAVVVNDKLVPVVTQPWDFPEHPVTLGGYLNLPTLFFPRSVAFDCVELQRELNTYESLIKLHAMTSAVDPWIVDINTMVNEITGRSDKVIKYKKVTPDSEPPHRAGAGQLDEGVYKKLEQLHAEFQNVSMAVDAFRGQDGSATAAAAIQQLRSQAELMFSKPAGNWRNFWRDTLRKHVKFLQKYYSFRQLAEILGADREEEIRAFLAADLDATVDWVASDHGLPRTKDELRQEMMTMFDKGALDVNDPAVRQKIYQLFGETGMMQSFNKDATNARMENQLFKTGMGQPGQPYVPPQVVPMHAPLEDNAVHLYFHADQVKSRDFHKWDPMAKKALIEHVMQTQMLMEPVPMPGQGQPGQADDGKTTQGQDPRVAPPTPVAAAQ